MRTMIRREAFAPLAVALATMPETTRATKPPSKAKLARKLRRFKAALAAWRETKDYTNLEAAGQAEADLFGDGTTHEVDVVIVAGVLYFRPNMTRNLMVDFMDVATAVQAIPASRVAGR